MTRGRLAPRAFVSLLLAVAACRTNEPEARLPQGPRRIVFEMKTIEKTIDGCIAGAPGCSYVRFDYPVIVEATSLADVDSIGETIQGFLSRPLQEGEEPGSLPALIDDFLAQYRELGAKDAGAGQTWFLERKAFVLHQRLILLSLSLVERYRLGAARQSDTVRFVNLDPRTGSTLALSDLLLPGAMPRLVSVAEARFREDPRFADPAIEFAVTENVSVGDRGLTLYYNPGDVVPAELGPAEIHLRYDEVDDLLAPEYRHEPET
jgi:hypothetical protein